MSQQLDFTLSDSTALIRFSHSSRKLHSAFRLDQKTLSQRSHVFRLTGTLHCGHNFVGGILTVLRPMTNNRTQRTSLLVSRSQTLLETTSLPSENKMAAIRVVQIHTYARFPRSKKWPTRHVVVPTQETLKLRNKAFLEKIT